MAASTCAVVSPPTASKASVAPSRLDSARSSCTNPPSLLESTWTAPADFSISTWLCLRTTLMTPWPCRVRMRWSICPSAPAAAVNTTAR